MSEEMELSKEILDRCVRIETRLTRYLESQGFETHVRRPFWNGKAIVITGLRVALQDMLAAIPPQHQADEVPVIHEGRIVMSLRLPPP